MDDQKNEDPVSDVSGEKPLAEDPFSDVVAEEKPLLDALNEQERVLLADALADLREYHRKWKYIKSLFNTHPTTKRFHILSLRLRAEQKGRDWLDIVHEQNPEALTADGFEECVIGVANRFGMEPVVAYDYDKCIDVLVNRDGMSYEEAVEFFEFNVIGSWVGEGTPVFVSTRSE